MQIIGGRHCPKHNLQAQLMCTKTECYQDMNILVCPQCLSKHANHPNDLIDVHQLTDKTHELMKKRIDFQSIYDKACDSLINELKKFKLFKEEILTVLNYRQRCLNDLCRKLQRNIPYQKDKQLFKKTLNFVYLSLKGTNPNYELHHKFQQHLTQAIKQCKNAIHHLNVNLNGIPLLYKKQNSICSILKKTQTQSIDDIHYQQPTFKQFKKQTIKFHKPIDVQPLQCKLFRIANEQFLAYSNRSPIVRMFNSDQLILPKVLPLGFNVDTLAIIDKNLFMTNCQGQIMIYDLLNERIVKQYASSNHKNSIITNLLAVDNSTVLNFITCPNQIAVLRFHEDKQSLKLLKGVETKSKSSCVELFDDQFIGCFDDKFVRTYRVEYMEKEKEYEFVQLMKSIAKMDHNTLLIGGQAKYLSLLDKRVNGIVSKIPIDTYVGQMKKIYPTSVLTCSGHKLSIMQCRMQKEIIAMQMEDMVKHIEVLNSLQFVTSGKSLALFKGV